MRPAEAFSALLVLLLVAPLPAFAQDASAPRATTLQLPAPTVVHALAVAESPSGFVGSVSNVSIIAAPGGTGHVFVDTQPLAQVDAQGSARLAVRVASAVTGIPLQEHDYFFVIRTEAPVIGGPSAGGILTVGTIAALEGWPVNASVMMTGTINPDGGIGPIGGLLEKISAAAAEGATLFLFPEGQEEVAPLTRSGAPQGAPVQVADHCARLPIRCVAVATVEDAVRYVTGHAFEPPAPSGGQVTSADYRALMRPLAENLTQGAHALVADVSQRLDAQSRNLNSQVRQDLTDRLGVATRAVVQADAAFGAAEPRYYTASSRSFQANVQARYVDYVLHLFATLSGGRDAFVRGILDDADQRAQDAAATATQPARSVSHLEGLGAAQERATEAGRSAASARGAYDSGDALAALQWAAQSRERSASVAWWLDIADRASGPGRVLDPVTLNRTARDLIDTARESLVYAQVLLQEEGVNSALLTGTDGAADLLDRAEADLQRGFVPAAVFEAMQAEVRASTALELAGASEALQESKLDRARERAGAAIVSAREAGLEPVLAQSNFEFAGDLTTPEDGLAFYNTARNVARLGRDFFAPASGARLSRFVGFTPAAAQPAGQPPGSAPAATSAGSALAGMAFLVGAVLGVALGVLVAVALRRTPPAPRAPAWPPLPPPPPALAPPPAAPSEEPAQDPPAPPAPRVPPDRNGHGHGWQESGASSLPPASPGPGARPPERPAPQPPRKVPPASPPPDEPSG